MKLPAFFLAGSLAANLACVIALMLRPALAPASVREFLHLHDAAAETRVADETRRRDVATAKIKSAQAASAAAANRALLWSALDSADLKTLVAHLRAAGFSPTVVRAIVSRRLEARFAARTKEIAGTATDTPYWKPDRLSGNGSNQFYEQMSQLSRERTAAMRDVLGDAFFADTAGEATAAQRREFGDLPKAKIDLIQRINDDYAEMSSQVRSATQGVTLPEDREKLVLLEREKRADLAAVLSPEEFRDYDMRNSNIAQRLRTTLSIMDATEEEFRTIYGIQQPLVDRLFLIGGVKGAEMSRQRKEAEQQVAAQLAAALGPSRAAEFTRAGDYDYQEFFHLTQQANLPVETAARAYDLRAATAVESRRISNDKTLGDEAKLAALQALAQSARNQFTATLGPTLGAGYVKSAQWLTHIENGGSISFGGSGSTTFYNAPKPAAPAPGK